MNYSGFGVQRYFSDDSTIKYPEILIYSRTVVEKNGFVSTGVLTYTEGDIMEIEIAQHEFFSLGESVKVTIYTAVKMFVFHTTIVAKGLDGIIVITPPDIRAKFGEKRAYPRVPLNETGRILAVNTTAIVPKLPSECIISNISNGGVGLLISNSNLLPVNSNMQLQFNINVNVTCSVQIVRSEEKEEGCAYGAKFVDLPDPITQALRSFILLKQLNEYYENKKKEKSDL